MDNYERSKLQAQAYFLRFDQAEILRSVPLRGDAEFLYLDFVGAPYRVCRKTGRVERQDGGAWSEAGFSETLSIFDLLCYRNGPRRLTGRRAPVNSLPGLPSTVRNMPAFHQDLIRRLDQNQAAFAAACRRLGGTEAPYGDIGYQIPIFLELSVILKFYGGDEEFPPQLTLLWDENTLSWLRYETVYYVADHLVRHLSAAMEG